MCLLCSQYHAYVYSDYDGDYVDAPVLRMSIKWNADGFDEWKDDDYFDRVVMVGLKNESNHKILSTGVLLGKDRVLTSYNPYRAIVKANRTNELIVALLIGKLYNETAKNYDQLIEYYSVACHSQILNKSEETLTDLQWHGRVKLHSPVHDLFVLRINTTLNLTLGKNLTNNFTETGPKIIPIADEKDWLGPNMKFTSLGYKNKAEIERHDMLSIKQFEEDDQPLKNCDEWIIRDWGWFLCVENRDLNTGIGSGAVLVFNETLFGIGSFTLKKGNSSIFVFTDVRPYRNVINSTCTKL